MILAVLAAVVGFIVGYVLACILTAARLNDLTSANDYLQHEVKRWRNEFENLKESMIKHVR